MLPLPFPFLWLVLGFFSSFSRAQTGNGTTLVDLINFGCLNTTETFSPSVYHYTVVVPASITKFQIDVYYSSNETSVQTPSMVLALDNSNAMETTLANYTTSQDQCAAYLNGSSTTNSMASVLALHPPRALPCLTG